MRILLKNNKNFIYYFNKVKVYYKKGINVKLILISFYQEKFLINWLSFV